ncbi:MAG: hypothetical protein JWM84_4032 [Nocardioides sp.]|nr:hypothetical protein [Nocardioides sp.]
MVATNTSPNVDNYYVGKGIVSVSEDEGTTWRDVGNVPEFEWEPNLEKLDHFSSRTGVRTKDRSIITEKSATLRIVMEEFSADNLSMILMGEPAGAGPVTMDIMSQSEKVLAVRFVGTNDIGPKITLEFPRVSFTPSGSFSPISDEWGQIEVEGEVQAVEGVFGAATWTAL